MHGTFHLNANCILSIEQGDITRYAVDAVVNAANESLLGGGGVDGAMHAAAGHQLLQACRSIPEVKPGVRCPTGQARITPAFRLPCRYIIHTVGPVFENSTTSQPLLASAFKESLLLANEHDVTTIAFPAISCGAFGYPHHEAADVAMDQCRRYAGAISRVYIVLFDRPSYEIWCEAIQTK